MHLPFFTIHAFQSTLSMRRATIAHVVHSLPHDISIHALHEESDGGEKANGQTGHISIHALHEESDYQLSAMLPELT